MKNASYCGSLVATMLAVTAGWLTLLPTTAPAATNQVTAKAAFEQLKGLAGEWRGQAAHGGDASDTTVTYRVVGAGSAVMETLFPGTPHEMVTMYHLDGDQLVLTHYCAAGNQPRMALELQKSTPALLVFEFTGGSNLDPAKDMHMHAGRIRLLSADSLESEWDSYQRGQKTGAAKFTLKREPAKK